MKPIDTTPPAQTHTLAFEVHLSQPPEKVWRALTDPKLLAEWLLPSAGFAPEPGRSFTLQAPPQPGWDGKVSCRVVDMEPLRRLSYTWVVGDLDTVVTFTLEPGSSGTVLTIVHSGFKPEQKHNFGGARYGWRMMGQRLIDLIQNPE